MKEVDKKRIQLNVSPNEETMDKLAVLVRQYGKRHLNVQNPAKAAADLLNKFIDVFAYLIEEQDRQLEQQVAQLKQRFTIEE